MKPVWSVYVYDFNKQQVEIYNIFNHRSFNYTWNQLLHENISKETFAQKIESELHYYFWGKCEWEIEIVDHLGFLKNGLKTDVYQQVMLNFDMFVEYSWKFYKGNERE